MPACDTRTVLKPDPYAPHVELDPSARNGRAEFLWNALILVGMLAIGALPVRFLISYYGLVFGGDNPGPDAWSVFAQEVANNLSITLGLVLVLTSFSTMPLHQSPLLTRAIAISACVLISLDFHLLRWRIAPEHPARAMIFAAMMPTMIVFGCGVPRAASYVLRYFRNLRPAQSGG
ncbi:hypothetical protein Poly21_22280 [Allorhodopirellula heiligendammensis]|uniref:Uncharacterized protein n=1 Tax=Allorhodopirellula heiligendammensis TaxID=2714739 RepID=A0A5C6C7Q3_9BACT|nr:hypothetical protein Poly21_22280 [Allorhodopirellula heiligendammensis]